MREAATTAASSATRDKAASLVGIAASSRGKAAFPPRKGDFPVVLSYKSTFQVARRAGILAANAFTAAIPTGKTDRPTELSAFPGGKAALPDGKAEIPTDKAEGKGGKAEIHDEKAEIPVETAEVAHEEARVARNEDHFPYEEEAKMIVTKAIQRSVATLKTKVSVPALIAFATAMVTRMTGNSAFPAPVPLLATVAAAVADLQIAEAAAAARTKGAVTVRDDKRAALVTLLRQLEGYIQNQADANLENGAAIIESAGLAVRKTAVRKPRTFTALSGPTSGSIKLVAASAGRRASYEWQYSADGGKTWTFLPGTLQAKTTITALTPGASVQFKYRPVLKAGDGDWSQAVTIIVK